MSDLNTSGFVPYDIGVLVRIKKHEEQVTKGGIIIAKNERATAIEAQQVGTLIAVGSEAFKGKPHHPKVGDTVYFAKYSGQFLYDVETLDNEHYRAMDDHDIRLIKGAN